MVRDIVRDGRESTGEDDGETKRGQRNMVVGRVVLRRKFELDNEGGSVGKLKNTIKARNE